MTALLYHDVIDGSQEAASGFSGADANIYKLPASVFEAHLDAIAATGHEVFSGTMAELEPALRLPGAVLLTFDDGGASAWPHIAGALDRRGWKGLFFVTTGRIGEPGFLSADAIRSLASDGHLVGSHTVTHPPRMATLPGPELIEEWGASRRQLEEILGAPMHFGSVPGGYYSDAVARTAGECGYRVLFTSEPRRHPWTRHGVLLAGRFSVVRRTPAKRAAALGTGSPISCFGQGALWNAKKVAKRLGGETWLRFRRRYWAWRAS